jgi:hypothetical protein
VVRRTILRGSLEQDCQFYILGDNPGRWLVGAGAHEDARSIDTHLRSSTAEGAQAQLMVNNLVVMLI